MKVEPAKPDRLERLALIYAVIVVLVASVIGGGTEPYLLSDRILQAMTLPLAFYGAIRFHRASVGTSFGIWLSAVVVLILANLMFLVHFDGVALGSSDPNHAISYALFLFALIGFLAFALTLSERATYHLALSFVAALLINITVAAVQMSYSRASGRENIFYEITAGFFANANHFSAFIYAAIPLVGFALLVHRRHPLAYLVFVVVAAVVIYAANSIAAIGLTTVVAAVTYYLFNRKRHGRASRLIAAASVLFVAAGCLLAFFTRTDDILGPDLRGQFAANTWRAALDHLPFGSGLGSFHVIYPRYETIDQDLSLYANYAHNDWLEALLETGLPGLLLILAAFAVVLVNALRSELKMAAAIGLCALAVHSLVDYPLRTFMVALYATFLLAISWRLSSSATTGRSRTKREAGNHPELTKY